MKAEKTIYALLCGHWHLKIHSLQIFFTGYQSSVYVVAVLKNGVTVDYLFQINEKGCIVWPFTFKIRSKVKKKAKVIQEAPIMTMSVA